MKKLVALLVLAGLLALPAAAFADPPEHANAALIIKLDEGCAWSFVDEAGNEYPATGSVHYVETSNGTWNLTCRGTLVEGFAPPDSAIVRKSTSEDPLGPCFTPFDTTLDWHAHVTPSGQSTFSCQGDLSP